MKPNRFEAITKENIKITLLWIRMFQRILPPSYSECKEVRGSRYLLRVSWVLLENINHSRENV
jgi:hypothetical protein